MRVIVIVFSIISLISCSNSEHKLPYYNTADYTPVWEVDDIDTFHTIRNFNLIDQKGQAFTEKDMDDKICVVDFFFTSCPGICPKMTTNMELIAKEFKNDNSVMIVSHTVTPETDTASVLNEFAQKKNINYKQWKLLTGTRNEIYDLGRRFYFIEEDLGENKDDTDFLHTENFVLLDKNKHIRGIYNGLDITAIYQLIKDIKKLKN